MPRSILQYSGLIAGVITLLALADGILHLSLDYILFQGNLVGRLGPPPGATPPPGGGGPPAFFLPLNQMFALNIIGYAALVVIFWVVATRFPAWNWLVDVLMIVYAVTVFYAWVRFGAPNPRGFLGYLSKSVEVVLVLFLLARLWGDITAAIARRVQAPTLANTV